jgi:hypothetical protein
MASPEPRSRRPSPEALALRRKILDLLAHCEDPAVEGAWLDSIGREETYLDASLARRAVGLPPLEGRRTLSADQILEPDWPSLKRAREADC